MLDIRLHETCRLVIARRIQDRANLLIGQTKPEKCVLGTDQLGKKSVFDPKLIDIRQNEPSPPNPCRLHPELLNPGLN